MTLTSNSRSVPTVTGVEARTLARSALTWLLAAWLHWTPQSDSTLYWKIPQELADFLTGVEALDDLYKRAKAKGVDYISEGIEVPGFKMVTRKGNETLPNEKLSEFITANNIQPHDVAALAGQPLQEQVPQVRSRRPLAMILTPLRLRSSSSAVVAASIWLRSNQ